MIYRIVDPAPPLFTSPRQTSAAAKRSINHQRIRDVVLGRFKRAFPGGLTDDEVQVALSMDAHTECPARLWLQRRGLVKQSGLNEVRKTRAGRNAIVWKFVPEENRTGVCVPARRRVTCPHCGREL